MKTFHFLGCRDIKMMIMTSYFRIRDDVIKFLKISQDFYPLCIPTKFQHDLLESEKNFEKFASLIMFLVKHPSFSWLQWQQ